MGEQRANKAMYLVEVPVYLMVDVVLTRSTRWLIFAILDKAYGKFNFTPKCYLSLVFVLQLAKRTKGSERQVYNIMLPYS